MRIIVCLLALFSLSLAFNQVRLEDKLQKSFEIERAYRNAQTDVLEVHSESLQKLAGALIALRDIK